MNDVRILLEAADFRLCPGATSHALTEVERALDVEMPTDFASL
jgi:cell wall assembly regulator SMI1